MHQMIYQFSKIKYLEKKTHNEGCICLEVPAFGKKLILLPKVDAKRETTI